MTTASQPGAAGTPLDATASPHPTTGLTRAVPHQANSDDTAPLPVIPAAPVHTAPARDGVPPDTPAPARHEQAARHAESALAIRAEGLRLTGGRGTVFGPMDLSIAPGTVTVFTGHAGQGKSSLLLTLVGRMKHTHGDLEVLGYPLPRRSLSVQHRTAAVGFVGLDDLDEEVTVRDTVRERLAWISPAWKLIRRPDDERIAELCRPVFGPHPVPSGRTVVHDLHEGDNLLLRLALAMMSTPQLIAIDEIDQLHDTDARDLVWDRLRAIAATGVTVVASTASPAELTRLGSTDFTVVPMRQEPVETPSA